MGKRRPQAAVVAMTDRVLACGCGPLHSVIPTHDSPVSVRRSGAARPALPSRKHARCFQKVRPGRLAPLAERLTAPLPYPKERTNTS